MSKFKPGDRVTNGCGENVIARRKKNDAWATREAYEYVGGGWDFATSLTLITVPKSVIVVSSEGPSRRPYVHSCISSAESEATRLVLKHPGLAFGVYVLHSTTTATKPVAPTVTKVLA
jgi:hypothetical protein